MSFWYHRNPLKATTSVDFNLKMLNPKADAIHICSELRRLRRRLIELFSDLKSSPVEVEDQMKEYLSLLHGLIAPPLGKVSPQSWSQMRQSQLFKWTHTLFENNVPTALNDIVFEITSILQEQAIWLTKYASNLVATPDITEEQAKLVYKALLKAAGLFKHVEDVWLPQLQEQNIVGSDLDFHVCSAYTSQCLGEAQEVTIARAIELNHSAQLITALCVEASRAFQTASSSLKAINDKNGLNGKASKWIKYLELKSHYYHAYAYCYFGINQLALEKCGEAIRCLQESDKLVKATLEDCKTYSKLKGVGFAAKPETHPALHQMQAMVKRTKDKCERENGLIFHQKVPIENIEIDVKASHGIVTPEEFVLPVVHRLWTPDVCSAFQLESVEEDKKMKKEKKDKNPLPEVEEKNVQEENKASAANHKKQSGCSIQ